MSWNLRNQVVRPSQRRRVAASFVAVAIAGLVAATAAGADDVDGADAAPESYLVVSGFERGFDVSCAELTMTVVDIANGGIRDEVFLLSDCAVDVDRVVISPDGSELAVSIGDSNWQIITMDASSDKSMVGCLDVAWSDDGSLVACVRPTGVVDVAVAETTHVVSRLTLPSGSSAIATFSGPTEIVVSAPASGAPCSLPVDALAPRTAMWRAAVADHEFVRLRDLPCGLDAETLDVSSDGRIAFISDGTVYVADADAGDPAQVILEIIDEADIAVVAWARDGEDIIVVAPGGEAGPIVERHQLFAPSEPVESTGPTEPAEPEVQPPSSPSTVPSTTLPATTLPVTTPPEPDDTGVDAATVEDPQDPEAEPPVDQPELGVDDIIVGIQIEDVQVLTPDGTVDSSSGEPPVVEPEPLEAADVDPVAEDPAIADPALDDPADEDPVGEDPTEVDPVDTDPVDTDPVVVIATLGVPEFTHTLGTNADDQEPPAIEFLGVKDSYSAGDRLSVSCVINDVGTGVLSSSCQSAVGPAHAFRGLNTLIATATDGAGNTTRATVSFVVSIPADELPQVFEELVVDDAGFADALRPHIRAARLWRLRLQLLGLCICGAHRRG